MRLANAALDHELDRGDLKFLFEYMRGIVDGNMEIIRDGLHGQRFAEMQGDVLLNTGGKDGVLGEPFYPCGVCRQIMREFCADDMPVYIADGEDGILELTLADLLPYSFGKEYL